MLYIISEQGYFSLHTEAYNIYQVRVLCQWTGMHRAPHRGVLKESI